METLASCAVIQLQMDEAVANLPSRLCETETRERDPSRFLCRHRNCQQDFARRDGRARHERTVRHNNCPPSCPEEVVELSSEEVKNQAKHLKDLRKAIQELEALLQEGSANEKNLGKVQWFNLFGLMKGSSIDPSARELKKRDQDSQIVLQAIHKEPDWKECVVQLVGNRKESEEVVEHHQCETPLSSSSKTSSQLGSGKQYASSGALARSTITPTSRKSSTRSKRRDGERLSLRLVDEAIDTASSST